MGATATSRNGQPPYLLASTAPSRPRAVPSEWRRCPAPPNRLAVRLALRIDLSLGDERLGERPGILLKLAVQPRAGVGHLDGLPAASLLVAEHQVEQALFVRRQLRGRRVEQPHVEVAAVMLFGSILDRQHPALRQVEEDPEQWVAVGWPLAAASAPAVPRRDGSARSKTRAAAGRDRRFGAPAACPTGPQARRAHSAQQACGHARKRQPLRCTSASRACQPGGGTR